jgi:hypothetical protein
MVRTALVIAVAAVFAATSGFAKAKQASAAHVQLQKPAPRCHWACPRYGWPSYLLSFPPPRWQ